MEAVAVPIANDGTVPLHRERATETEAAGQCLDYDNDYDYDDPDMAHEQHERVAFQHLFCGRHCGDTVRLRMLRQGRLRTADARVRALPDLVPRHIYGDTAPEYLLFAGLVFQPLTRPYLWTFGEDWFNSAPKSLVKYVDRVQQQPGEQVVLISQLLADEVNSGYRQMTDVRVMCVDGEPVVSLRQLHGLLRAAVARASAVDALQAFVTIELEDKRQIVLDAREADSATARIMRRCRIPRSVSQGLLP